MCKLKKRINYYWGFNWPLGQSSINRIVKMHDLFILEGAGKRGVAWSFKWSLGQKKIQPCEESTAFDHLDAQYKRTKYI